MPLIQAHLDVGYVIAAAIAAVPAAIGARRAKHAAKQLSPNSGSSVLDTIRRIERRQSDVITSADRTEQKVNLQAAVIDRLERRAESQAEFQDYVHTRMHGMGNYLMGQEADIARLRAAIAELEDHIVHEPRLGEGR